MTTYERKLSELLAKQEWFANIGINSWVQEGTSPYSPLLSSPEVHGNLLTALMPHPFHVYRSSVSPPGIVTGNVGACPTRVGTLGEVLALLLFDAHGVKVPVR